MKVCIIGAGLGGLFTGAILAKEGFEVTVLEKNATIGGGLVASHHRVGLLYLLTEHHLQVYPAAGTPYHFRCHARRILHVEHGPALRTSYSLHHLTS